MGDKLGGDASKKLREEAVEQLKRLLQDAGAREDKEALEEALWSVLLLYQDEVFVTAKGLDFTYCMKRGADGAYGNEVFFSRKEKSITRATVNLAFARALKLQGENGEGAVSGPKKLGVFGASYLYPVFLKIGVIDGAGKETFK